MDTQPLIRSHERHVNPTTVFKATVKKNILIMLREKAQIKKEIGITVLYFAFLIMLSRLGGSQPPPLAPGHIVNPAFTFTTLSGNSGDGAQTLTGKYNSGQTKIGVAPCVGASSTSSEKIFKDLKINYPSLHDSNDFEYPLNWTCYASKELLLARAHNYGDMLAGIVFNVEQDSKFLNYELFVNASLVPSSLNNFSASDGIPVNQTQQWLTRGIVALQHSVQLSVTRVAAGATDPVVLADHLVFRQEPFHDYRTEAPPSTVGTLAPMYYIIIAAITSQSWVKTILEEKEKQVRI